MRESMNDEFSLGHLEFKILRWKAGCLMSDLKLRGDSGQEINLGVTNIQIKPLAFIIYVSFHPAIPLLRVHPEKTIQDMHKGKATRMFIYLGKPLVSPRHRYEFREGIIIIQEEQEWQRRYIRKRVLGSCKH